MTGTLRLNTHYLDFARSTTMSMGAFDVYFTAETPTAALYAPRFEGRSRRRPIAIMGHRLHRGSNAVTESVPASVADPLCGHWNGRWHASPATLPAPRAAQKLPPVKPVVALRVIYQSADH